MMFLNGVSILFQDRDAYSEFMEAKMENLSMISLDIRSFAEQLDRIDRRVSAMETKSGLVSNSVESNKFPSNQPTVELDIVFERLKRVEESLDKRKPLVNFPNRSIEDVWLRLDEVETCSARLAEDTLAVVQGVHEELAGLRKDFTEEVEKRTGQVEERLEAKLSEGVEKISLVLRKLVAVQKSLSSARTRDST
jgi:hypothetical protein